MRKMYKDLDDDTIAILKEVYFPIFDKISGHTLEEAYIKVKNILPFDIGESAIRKNLKKEYDILKDTQLFNDDINVKRSLLLDKEIHKVRREKLTFNAVKRETFDKMKLLEDLSEELVNLNITKYPEQKTLDVNPGDFTAFISDAHIGKYTYETHASIFEAVYNHIIQEYVRWHQLGQGGSIKLVFVGDMVEGLLRQSALRQIKAGMVEQVRWATEIIINCVENLSTHLVIDEILFIDSDNHGEIRPLGSGRDEFPLENLSAFLSDALKRVAEHKNIKYQAGETLVFKDYKVEHGHQYKGKAVEKYYDKSIIGHFHNYMNKNDTHITLPALVYGDRYTKSLGIRGGEPEFVVYFGGYWKKIKLEVEND